MKINRNQHLIDLIKLHKPSSITEVGFAKGQGAAAMILTAAEFHERISYDGFDLFEGLSQKLREEEFQGKDVLSIDEASAFLDRLAKTLHSRGVVLDWNLHKGPTSKTLLDSRADKAKAAEFCYIDGGHSVETIRNDAELLSGCRIKVFDDFYYDRPAAFLSKFGCNTVIQELYPNDFAILPVTYYVPAADGTGTIAVGQVVTPRQAWPWARLQAALVPMRHHKPLRTFIYADDVSKVYLASIARADWGGAIVQSPGEPADFAYIDCARWAGGKWNFMTEEEQAEVAGVVAPIQVYAGLLPDTKDGCGHIIDRIKATAGEPMIVVGLDVASLEDGTATEVGAFVTPKTAWPQNKAEVHVNTRNCVADEVIIRNIEGNTPRIKKWATICKHHRERCLFVSAGPSLATQISEIKSEVEKGGRVVCVKHAHDTLIEGGIIPWACVLLDPRDHVKQFIQNPHPETIYFTASMVSTTTVDILLEKNARIVGYHALVGAGEDKILPKGTNFLVGGTSAATRGLPLMMMLGFREFVLFAYDSCFTEKPANVKEKTVLGYDRFIKVEIEGKKFWSELELVAQAQDFREFVKTIGKNELMSGVELDVRGNGIIPHLWNVMSPVRPSLNDASATW